MKSILAVDDSPVILSLIKDILSNHDYKVETAEDGQEALEKYVKFKPHVVTLDLAMPGMDGYQTLSKIKDIDRYANVIMITASEHSSALQQCLQKGAVGFLTKPFKPKELVSTIEEVLISSNYHDRNIVSMFLLVSDRIQNMMKSMFPHSAVSVVLEDVKVLHNALSSSQPERSYEQAPSMSSAYDSMPSDVKHISYSDIMIPSEEQVSFLTEIDGQQIGMVISFIKKSDLKVLFGDSPDDSMESSKAKEFFNILNTKVLSQLADATHLNLKTRPTVYFKKPKEKEHFWRSTSSMWDQIARASFKANYDGHAIPIDIQLWYDGGRIFT